MSEHSPTPWEIPYTEPPHNIYSADGKIVLEMPEWVANSSDVYQLSRADAEHIVKCVNMHEELVATVGRLLHDVETLCDYASGEYPEVHALLAKAKGE